MSLHSQSVLRDGLFKGKVAIVTGGGTGIGKCIATELIALGCSVVIASRTLAKLDKAAADIRRESSSVLAAFGNQVIPVQCNIRKEMDVQRLMATTLEKLKRIDFLVNNGGGQFPSPAFLISTKGWKAVIETNLTGTFLCCREVYKAWMQENGGSIVNIIADMKSGFPGMVHTGAARAGVDNITKTLAVEWASSGVRINSVAPGPIYSETAAANYADPLMFQKAAAVIPAKRLGTVQEVASPVCFLLSKGASYITGQTLYVAGGNSIHGSLWQVPHHTRLPPYGPPPPPTMYTKDPDATFKGLASKL